MKKNKNYILIIIFTLLTSAHSINQVCKEYLFTEQDEEDHKIRNKMEFLKFPRINVWQRFWCGNTIHSTLLKKALKSYKGEKITLNAPDGNTLSSVLFTEEEAQATVIFLNGFPFCRSTPGKSFVIPYLTALEKCNINMIMFDWRADGESTGKYSYFQQSDFGLTSCIEDIDCIIEEIKKRFPQPEHKIILHGFCFGSGIALHYAYKKKNVDGLILDSPFSNFKNQFYRSFDFMGLFKKISFGEHLFKWCMNGNPFDMNPLIEISQLELPLLIIGCTQDKISKLQEASDLFKAADKSRYKVFIKDEVSTHSSTALKTPSQFRKIYQDFLKQVI